MAHLTVGVLGAMQVRLAGGETVKFRSDQTRALLAYLAVEADRPHRREALTGLLWPDEPEEVARRNLRQALHNLRLAIGDAVAHPPFLLITHHEIQFNTASDFALDAADFDAHLAVCASHPHARLDACAICAPRLQQAVDLYRGQFLQEFFLKNSAAFEEWALTRRESFHHRALEALGALGTYCEQHGDLGATRRSALRALELDPWREEAHRQMMRVFARAGQQGAALAQYETCRRVLAEQMGVEPSRETRELYETIKSGNWKEPSSEAAKPQHPTPTPRAQLPTYLTPFLGREREMADLARLVGNPSCRLITLAGPGGMGKTRLAVQSASQLSNVFPHGVAFVPLVAIESVEATVPAIAEALGFSFYGPTPPRLQLFNYLRDKRLLLVLDNTEHLLVEDPVQGNAADLFVQLLGEAGGIKLLVTSREPLGVQGEWVFPVEGLQNPEGASSEAIESSAAAALFVQCAQRARVGFALNEADRPYVAKICRLVDGTPLALELAATWVRALPVKEIVEEIERTSDFLATSGRDVPERHRSMRVVFDHSWKMLAPEEQRVLRALSVFRGRFQRLAAEQVAGASLATLSVLLAKSLVRRTDTGHYDLHELVRQYAASRLAEDELASVSERHSRFYLEWLARCMPAMQDRRQKETVTELAAEVDNLRAAWERAVRHLDLAHICEVSPALWYLFELRSWFAEGEGMFRQAAETIQARAAQDPPGSDWLAAENIMQAHGAYFSFRLGKSTAAYAVLLPASEYLRGKDQSAETYVSWYLGLAAWYLGKVDEAREWMLRSLEKARARGERWHETSVGQFIGMIALDQGEYEPAQRYLTEALSNARGMGDPMLISHILGFLGRTTLARGESVEAEKLLRESLAITQEIRYRHGIGNALEGLGLVAQLTNRQEADRLFSASCDAFRAIDDRQSLSRVLCHRGYNSFALENVAAAQSSSIEVLRLAREGGYMPYALDALVGLALVSAKHARDERALELVYHVLQQPVTPKGARSRAERLRAELETRMMPPQIQAAQAHARRQPIDHVINEVLEEPSWSPRSTQR